MDDDADMLLDPAQQTQAIAMLAAILGKALDGMGHMAMVDYAAMLGKMDNAILRQCAREILQDGQQQEQQPFIRLVPKD